jgi:dimeric dUTPase (all-alpha-NTP-PPase superfamily)
MKDSDSSLRQDASMNTKDMFREIFSLQQALNLRIGVDSSNMTSAQRVEWILNYARALSQETAELIDSVPWKWWAKYQEFDEQNARVEVVDMLHFVVSLAQVLGMDADDIYQRYTKKNEVNLARQDTGYVAKDEADSKHV